MPEKVFELVQNLPTSMGKLFKKSIPYLDLSSKVTVNVDALDFELPKFGDTK
jgi:hypothetical protein